MIFLGNCLLGKSLWQVILLGIFDMILLENLSFLGTYAFEIYLLGIYLLEIYLLDIYLL
jgi:hypothetical protein